MTYFLLDNSTTRDIARKNKRINQLNHVDKIKVVMSYDVSRNADSNVYIVHEISCKRENRNPNVSTAASLAGLHRGAFR